MGEQRAAGKKIFLIGPSRSGKTSVANVVFKKMSPHETLFLEVSQRPESRPIGHMHHLAPFVLVDYPASHNWDDSNSHLFKDAGAVMYMLDAQDDQPDQQDRVQEAAKVIILAYKVNPDIHFEVLIHKVDGDMFVTDEHKIDCQRDVHNILTTELRAANVDASVAYHRTSIYDYSVFEAFSKIVQKLITNLNNIEQLLDHLVSCSKIEKVFLFDLVSKIYLATDSQPGEDAYEICSDMIDVVIDVSVIYGVHEGPEHLLAGDAHSSCSITLNNGMVLYLREVDKHLALVCLVKEEALDRQHLIDYNIDLFKGAMRQLFPRDRVAAR